MTVGTGPRPAVAGDPPSPHPRRVVARGLLTGAAGTAVILLVLMLVSAWVRTRALRAGLWVDEGLSVGIASHAFGSIPHVLREDGSPPLYFAILHVWMSVVGDGEARTHALSLIFALLTVPAALWAGWSLAGRRAGWACAVLAAVNPFLTIYGQETRMYSLVVLLGIVCTAFFLHAFVRRRSRYAPAFGLALAALLYTHNWALFFAAASLAALVPLAYAAADRRRLLRDAAIGFGIAIVLYAPWVPTLIYQAAHTGAPWSKTPHISGIPGSIYFMLGAEAAAAVLLVGGAGVVAIRRLRPRREWHMVVALGVMTVGTYLLAFAASHVNPAWAPRYLAAVLAPLLLLAGLALARAGRLGIAALAVVAFLGVVYPSQVANKSNVRELAHRVRVRLQPGDLVVTTQPEQVAALHYYLPAGLRYADPTGLVADPRVMDWRDALGRLRRSRVARDLIPLVNGLRPGTRILLVMPTHSGGTEWANLIRRRSRQWDHALVRDPSLRRQLVITAHHPGVTYSRVKGILFVKLPA